MENNFLLTDDMLWDYADGFLEEREKFQVEAYLQQHPEHQHRYAAIQAEKRAFAGISLEKPNVGFADRVMAAWVAEQAHARDLAPAKGRDWIVLSITSVFGLFLLAAFTLVIGTAPAATLLTIPNQYVPKIPAVDWSMILSSAPLRYSMILILALLTLQLLDKYLRQRNQTQGLIPGH